MKLSIVIPVYNTEKYLEKCLASCVNQEVEKADYEIVVVDDGTKDNAMAIALRYQENYPNIKIFSQENAGLSAARNMGLSHCWGTGTDSRRKAATKQEFSLFGFSYLHAWHCLPCR